MRVDPNLRCELRSRGYGAAAFGYSRQTDILRYDVKLEPGRQQKILVSCGIRAPAVESAIVELLNQFRLDVIAAAVRSGGSGHVLTLNIGPIAPRALTWAQPIPRVFANAISLARAVEQMESICSLSDVHCALWSTAERWLEWRQRDMLGLLRGLAVLELARPMLVEDHLVDLRREFERIRSSAFASISNSSFDEVHGVMRSICVRKQS